MPLSETDVAAIAQYAQFELSDQELADMTSYMNDAIDMLAPIEKYDLQDIQPTIHPTGDLSNVMREDEQAQSLDIDTALSNAGSVQERFVRVPSILGEGSEA